MVPMIVGKIIIPRMIDVVRSPFPSPAFSTIPICFNVLPNSRTIGTSTTRPKNPYTTEGIPANSSVAAFSGLYIFFGQYIAINTDVRIPIGTPNTIAPAVTYKLPMIIGKIPNRLLFGLHSSPVINFTNPISLIAGTPFANKKIQMRATASTEVQAAIKNTPCMNFSVHAFDFILLSSYQLFSYFIPSISFSCVDGFYLIRT